MIAAAMSAQVSSLLWSQIANQENELYPSSVLLEIGKLYWQRRYSSLAKIRASVEKCSDLKACSQRDWEKIFNERPCSRPQ